MLGVFDVFNLMFVMMIVLRSVMMVIMFCVRCMIFLWLGMWFFWIVVNVGGIEERFIVGYF